MHTQLLKRLALWLLVGAFGLSSAALADEDKRVRSNAPDRGPEWEAEMRARAPETGNCRIGTAEKDLDVNNVQARMYNIGNLFFRSGSPIYIVPKDGGVSSVFAHGLWIGGKVDDEIRVAGATYAQFGNTYEYWPGPLNDDGTLPFPNDCARFDRLYKVGRDDILDYEQTGTATADLQDWPVELGAPVVDGDGDPDNYSLAGGDRPDLEGDQAIWWVMNDVGNVHGTTGSLPIGLEIQVKAFAFARSDALNNTTFYRYKIIYKGDTPLEETFMALFSDPDVGYAFDDYIGSNPDLGLGFAYNGDDFDDASGDGSYLDNPPAVGYDFFRGPITDVDDDGEPDTLGMTRFTYFTNGAADAVSDPDNALEYYNYMTGFWADGLPFLFGGNARENASGGPTDFVYSDFPPNYWSEFCTEGEIPGTTEGCNTDEPDNEPGDRRFLQSTGPFTLNPGETQEIVFGIVWAQGGGGTLPQIASVDALERADVLAQTAFDIDFELARPPDPPQVNAVNLDRQAVITWSYSPTSNNYLGQYEEVDPLLRGQDVEDSTYTFEGFNVYRFPNDDFNPNAAERVATFDIINDITRVIDTRGDPETGEELFVAADGSNTGLQYFYVIESLTNYTDYYYGVSAYAVNDESVPKVLESPIAAVTLRPSMITAAGGGATASEDELGEFIVADVSKGSGGGTIRARLVDPLSVPADASYEVEFYSVSTCDEGGNITRTAPSYSSRSQSRLDESNNRGAAAASARRVQTRQNLKDGLASAYRHQLAPAQTQEAILGEGRGINRGLAARGGEDPDSLLNVLTYTLTRVTESGTQVLLDGCAYFQETGETLPTGEDFFVVDGLSFTILSPDPGPVLLGFADDGDPIYAFVEVQGPGGTDPCAPDEGGFIPFGCQEGYGDVVYGDSRVALSESSLNDEGVYAVFNRDGEFGDFFVDSAPDIEPSPDDPDGQVVIDPGGPEEYIAPFTPNEFDIRFTEDGYALSQPGTLVRVPFTIWDVGEVSAFEENDPSDDVQLIPELNSDNGTPCVFSYGDTNIFTGADPARVITFDVGGELLVGVPATDAIANAYYVKDGDPDSPSSYAGRYDEFEAEAEMLLDGDEDACITLPVGGLVFRRQFIGLGDDAEANQSPVKDVIFLDITGESQSMEEPVRPPDGIIVRFYTINPIRAGDTYVIDASEVAFNPDNEEEVTDEEVMALIGAVPNPYKGRSAYETGNLDRVVRFVNLPDRATLRIFTLAGTLIRTLEKSSSEGRSLDWDLTTQTGLPVASGMYLVHVETDFGEKVIKLGVVNRRIQLQNF